MVCVKVGALNSSISLLSFIELALMMGFNFFPDLRKTAGNSAFDNALYIPVFPENKEKSLQPLLMGSADHNTEKWISSYLNRLLHIVVDYFSN